MKKYWHLFRISLKQRNVFMFDVLSSLFSYSVRILLIVSLFRYLYSTSPHLFANVSLKELWWGLVFAQIAAVWSPNLAWRVSEDVKSGKVAVHLLNPVSYPVFKVFEVLSWAFSNLVVMTVLAFGIGAYFVGLPEITLGWTLGSLFFLVGAFLMFALLNLNVGLCAFIFEEISPLQWIVKRFVMFFGGNILPIPFFPVWLQTVAYASPFAFTGYVAGLTFAKFDFPVFLAHSAVMVFWLLALSALASFSYSRFSRRLVSNGG